MFFKDFEWIGMGCFWNFQFTFKFAFSPKIPTECPFPFAFTFRELTFMNAIHELGQLLISECPDSKSVGIVFFWHLDPIM